MSSLTRRGVAYGACPQGRAGAAKDPERVLPEAMDSRTYGEILARLPELRADPKAPHEAPERELDPRNSYLYHCAQCFLFRRLQDLGGDEGTENEGYSEAEMKLRMDLSANKVCWVAEFWTDLWEWTRNCNPLLALFYSHPLHPISRAERIFITVLHTFFIIMISSATPRAKMCIREGLGQCHAPLAGEDLKMVEFCCMSARVGLSGSIAHIPLGLGGNVYAIVLNVIFAQLMYQVGAGCACVQNQPRRVRRCWELLGHIFMVLVFLGMLWPIYLSANWNVRTGHVGGSIGNFCLTKPVSMLGTTAVQTLVFIYLWRQQMMRDAAGECYKEFYVTASDYQAYVGVPAPEGELGSA